MSALPALRGIATPAALGPFPSLVRLDVDTYRPAVLDEVVEVRLSFDGATGRLAIADGEVRHEAREGRAAIATWSAPSFEVSPDPTAALGSRVDLVA
jgi:hypothetical protein